MSRRVPSTPNAGPGVPLRERGGQIEVDEPDRGELLDLEEVAGDGREQVRQRGAEVVEREAQPQPGAPAGRRVADRAGQRRRAGQRHLVDALDLGGEPRAQVVGLARDPHERAGGLLAREHLGRLLQRQRGLDHVGRDDVRGATKADVASPDHRQPHRHLRRVRGCPTRSRG